MPKRSSDIIETEERNGVYVPVRVVQQRVPPYKKPEQSRPLRAHYHIYMGKQTAAPCKDSKHAVDNALDFMRGVSTSLKLLNNILKRLD